MLDLMDPIGDLYISIGGLVTVSSKLVRIGKISQERANTEDSGGASAITFLL